MQGLIFICLHIAGDVLVNPYLKEGLSNILDENGFKNYSLGIITSDQNETGSFNYFMKEFVYHEDKKIDEMFKENHFDLKYRIFFLKNLSTIHIWRK